jgi:hypothetical protein
MLEVVEEAKRQKRQVVVLTETHFDVDDSSRFAEIAEKSGFATFSVTRVMKRFDSGSGGVTIMVDLSIRAKEVKRSTQEDLIWVCLEIGKEKLYVGGVYLVPNTSSRANKVPNQLAELEQDLALYRLDGRALVAGDWNCKVGQLASEIGDRIWTRRSVSSTVDTRGKHIMGMMNAAQMVVLNGIRDTVAQYTCKTWQSAEGEIRQGVDDYIAVSADMIGRVSELEYQHELRELFETDHCGLACTIHVIWYQTILKDQEGKKQQQRKENFRDVSRIVNPEFWRGLREGVKQELVSTSEEMDNSNVEQSWNVLKKGVMNVLREGKKRARAKKRGKQNGQTEEEKIRAQLSILRREKKAAAKEQQGGAKTERYRQTVKHMHKLRKQLQKQWWKEKMEDIEQSKTEKNEREYWRKITELAGWKKGRGRKLPEVLIDAEGTEKTGVDRLKVAADTFRKLGEDDQSDPDFDLEFAESVKKQIERLEKEEMIEGEEEKESEKEQEHRSKLGGEISQVEVNKAIHKLKNGKAAGQDAIIAEVVKRAGDPMRHAVWKMCSTAWSTEKVPHEWMQGLIFPLYKDGDDRDLLNYRGITLLSIVAKVYCSVLANRLMIFAEREGAGIVEEQGGFRPRRGTDDQLFALTETLRLRTGKVTYAAFIDVKKAYDTVWRVGLWKRLWEEGVRGKMWRVVKGMYQTVESAVLVGEESTEWFELQAGVRQGCVMSPVLFSLFINGLARELKKRGQGVDIGGRRVQMLLYADDIALLAETPDDLQRMLDVVSEYSRKWRFRVNPKKGKSEVMVFGRKNRVAQKWMLAGKQIGETNVYKYLGVELCKGLSFKLFKERKIKEARQKMMRVWAMGMRGGQLPAKQCVDVWKAIVRPVLEYGAAVIGDVKWQEAEQIQRRMGKMILRCSEKMTNEVVLGELGWWTMKGRRDMMRLLFWGKIVGMSHSRLAHHLYSVGRTHYQAGKQSRWCKETHALMQTIGLEHIWSQDALSEEESKSWHATLQAKIQQREEEAWRKAMQGKPKLRTYQLLKDSLCFEDYLKHPDLRARETMTRLRGGTNELRIEKGRHRATNRDRILHESERVCLICVSGEVEDECHFLIDCAEYEDLREEMFRVVDEKMLRDERAKEVRKEEEGKQRLMNALIGHGVADKSAAVALRNAALHFCKRAMKRRNAIVMNYLDQKT